MQIYAAAEAVSEVLIESEVLEKMERTTNLIRDSMHETVQIAKEEDYQVILSRVSEAIGPKNFHDFPLEPDSHLGCTLYQRVYGSGDLHEQNPETIPQKGTVVQLVDGVAGKKAFKLNVSEFSPDSFHECFSTIYIQSVIKSLPDTVMFRFTSLEIAGLYHQEECQQGRLFMISECASGHSIDNYADIVTCEEEEGVQDFLSVISRTAIAFAQLHQYTKRELEKEFVLQAIARSYETALERIKKHLLNYRRDISTREIAITVRFYDFLSDIDNFSDRIVKEDEDLSTAYLRNTTLIHGDAHIGNIFYDCDTDRVTFIDYRTAIESFKYDADPLKDLGCFLESVWLKLAGVDGLPERLYEIAVCTRNVLIRYYMENKGENLEFLEKVSQRVKLYMWCQLFDFFYSLDEMEYSAETIECLKYFLRREFS